MGVMNDCFPGGVLGGFLMWCGRDGLERGRVGSAGRSRDVPEHQPSTSIHRSMNLDYILVVLVNLQ